MSKTFTSSGALDSAGPYNYRARVRTAAITITSGSVSIGFGPDNIPAEPAVTSSTTKAFWHSPGIEVTINITGAASVTVSD